MQGLGKLLAFVWQLMYLLLLPYDTGDFHSQVFKVQLEFLPTRLPKANTLNLNPKTWIKRKGTIPARAWGVHPLGVTAWQVSCLCSAADVPPFASTWYWRFPLSGVFKVQLEFLPMLIPKVNNLSTHVQISSTRNYLLQVLCKKALIQSWESLMFRTLQFKFFAGTLPYTVPL
jgi:hypothetical protein